ncbi:MAG TPA: ATP-binding protein [Gaiellaceae bacterium]|nr:ATP-binding protein [Gaiellaceae bacterium]
MSPAADVQLDHGHDGWLARARRLPAIRAVGVRVPLVARIALASALLAVLVAAAFAILVVALSELRATTIDANRSKDVTSATLVLEQNLLQLDAGLRGYVDTGDRRFLRSWRDARDAVPASIAALHRSAAGREGQEARARRLATAVRDYVSDYAVLIIGIAEVNPAVARSPVALTEGRRRLDAIRRQTSEVLTVENDRAAARVASATGQANRAIVVGIAALAVSVFLVLLFGVELSRAVARPVRRVSDAAKDVAGGDLSVRLPTQGPAEVYDLAAAFNEMAASLERSKQELEQQNRQLRESERLRSELISVISHEVRTPLACVLGYASLLQARPQDEGTRQQYLAIISDEARRLESLVDELVDVRRIEEGRLELEPEAFDLRQVLEEQARTFQGRSDRHTIRLELPDGPLAVHADRSRVTQVVANVLGNAIKYSPDGGPVEVRAAAAEDGVRVSTRDHGAGIAEDDRSRIFTKYFRGQAGSGGIVGMGLGLAVSREIVEAHGGRMGFESEVGEGSVFWFELPMKGAGNAG